MRFAAVAVIALAVAGTAAARTDSTFTFSFSAKNTTASIQGNGTISLTSFTGGSVSVTAGGATLLMRTNGYAYKGLNFPHNTGHTNTLTLTVVVLQGPCATNTTGKLTIVESTKVADSLALGGWNAPCTGFTQTWPKATVKLTITK